MSNDTADAFAARMKFLAAQDFGGSQRPGLVAAIANGTASADDMTLVSGFIKALDLGKIAQANQVAGINAETSPQNSDLLTSIGEDGAIVQRANSAVTAAKNPSATGQYLNNTLQTIATYAANSGDVIFPQSTSFAPGHKAPDGSSNETPFQKAWGGVVAGLNWVGRIPGFIYQGMNLSGYGLDGPVGSKKWAEHAMGFASSVAANPNYDAKSGLSQAAFLWSHGESDFNDLGPAIARHGQPLVDTAVKMFQADEGYGSSAKTLAGNVDFEQAFAAYQNKLNVDLAAGTITPEQYTAETKKLSSPDLKAAYQAVDAAHVSLGRDLANIFVNYDDHPTLFKAISGTGDVAWSMFADPTLVGGKALKGIQGIRYGVEAMDASKLSKLYGVADPVTGEIPKLNSVLNRGAYVAQRRVTTFLAYNKAIREATANGNPELAAALMAENFALHPDLKPLYQEAQGWRQAASPEEFAKAKADGTTMSLGGDAVHEAMAPARGGKTPEELAASQQAFKDASIPSVRVKPIENLDEWVDLLNNKAGLVRFMSGQSIRAARMLPGLMGIGGEIRASLMGRMAFNRTLAGAAGSPLFATLAKGATHLSEIDIDKDAGKLIASDEGEALKTAYAANESGEEIGGRDASSWVRFARGLKAKNDAVSRRLSTWLPTNHFIALNSAQAGQDFERFVRTWSSKSNASFARYLWENADSESARRQIGRAVVNQVVDASGITRSPAGRAWMEKWNAAFDDLENVRYGLADTDKIADAARGERRVAMHLYQMETHLVLPPFVGLRRMAAKAAIAGFDKPVIGLTGKTAAKLKQLIAGDTPMKSWITTESGERDVVSGMRRILASPSMSVRYGLFNNQAFARVFQLMKLGWLGTTSNAIRQFGEEYVGLRLGGHAGDLAKGKQLARSMGVTTALIAKTHHMIPHFLRQSITSEGDVYSAISHGKLAFTWGERPLDALDETIKEELAEMSAQREALELLGGRQSTQAEGGVLDAIDAHTHDVQMQPVGWKRGEFQGYTEGELRDAPGLKALAASYAMFLDKDEPARRVLAYLMWNHAVDKKHGAKFLASLDDDTLKLMNDLVPVERAKTGTTYDKLLADAPIREFDANGELTHDVRVGPKMAVEGSGKNLSIVRQDMSTGGKTTRQPLKYVYRVVSKDDYERMKRDGVLNTNGADSHGRNADGPQMFGSVSPSRLAHNYGSDSGSVLLKIKYATEDGWYKELRDGQEAYVATRKSLPFERVEAAAPFKAIYDEDAEKTLVHGTDGKITPPLLDSIKSYIRDAPEMGSFRQRAEWLKHDETGHPIPETNQVAKDAAIERYVHSQVFNVGNHVFARESGKLRPDLVSKLLRGLTPSDYDLSKIPLKDLPEHVIQAEYAPAVTGSFDKLGEVITSAAAKGGKAFDHIVTNPIQRMERKPLFYGNYARARRELQPFLDKMVNEWGYPVEDATGIVKRMSLGRGLQDTLKYLDNPKIASQMSAIVQNFWLFYRAQEDFARRWVGILKERPETLRLAHMAILAGVHSGMLYRDSDGNLTLAYPGSGAIIDGFLMAQRALGIADESGVKVPVAHDLTTQLDYLNPGIMSPYGFSATPMVSIPWDLVKNAIPGHDMLKSSVDMAFHGQLGNGRSWYEQFMPTEINRLLQLQGDNTDTGSLVGGAAATTILHASIAGQLDDGADDVQRQHKITDLKTQTMAAAYVRALFSFAAPGATSMPELDYKDKKGNFVGDPEADLGWRALGVKNMHDEFQALIQSVGVDKALVVWSELHPHLLPYSAGKTKLGAPGAQADPTQGATQWILENQDLFKGPYSRVAAYFIPPAPGTFDQVGWNALQEIGVRQNKSLEEYYLDIASKNAITTWYDAKDKYEGEIAKQRAAGQRVTDLEDEYTKVKAGIKAEYPILDSYFQSHGARQSQRTQMVSELRKMTADQSVKVPDLKGVAKMLIVLDEYNAQVQQLKGQRSVWATTTRQNLNVQYEDAMKGISTEFPNLKDLYNGVFREMEQ